MELTQEQYKKIEKSLSKKRGNWQMAYDILAPLQAERIIHINVDVKRGYAPIVPTKRSYKEQWKYDKELYKRRNEVERFFCRLKCFRLVFTRYDKPYITFTGFILLSIIINSLV